MGFIEDERKRRWGGEVQRKNKAIREQQDRERKQRFADEWAAKVAREKMLSEQAKQQFEQSGLGGMISELEKIGSHRGSHQNNVFEKYVVSMEIYVGSKVSIWTTADGTISIEGGKGGSTILSKDKWQGNKGAERLERALGKAYKHPNTRYISSSDGFSGGRSAGNGYNEGSTGGCLHGNSSISTPNGLVAVKSLKSGDLVWTVDKFRNRIQAVIVQKTKRLVSKNHKMAHIVLEDGRELIVSPGHPTIENKELGSLKVGQFLDQSEIISLRIISYKEKYTYDILPDEVTGGYWANNILIGSTLSSQFKKNRVERKIDKQASWEKRLFI